MPPSVLPEETISESPYQPTTSKKWLVQVAFLFGLLLLGRGSRYVAAPPTLARAPTQARRPTAPFPKAPEVLQQKLPRNYSAIASAFFEAGQ